MLWGGYPTLLCFKIGRSGPSVSIDCSLVRFVGVAMDQLTRWQQPANWVQNLTNCNWQLEIMILTPS